MSNLSTAERLILTNQFKLLNATGGLEEGQHDELIEMLEHGYALQINEWLTGIERHALNETECRFVIELMDLFDLLYNSWQQLSEAEQQQIAEWRVRFSGFDSEHEFKYLEYVRYLVDTEKCWTHFRRDNNFDSQRPTLDRYKTLLRNFEACQLQDAQKLSFAQLQDILNQAY